MNSLEEFLANDENAPPGYLVIDTESVPDGKLIENVRYPGETLDPHDAIKRFQQERLKEAKSDFIPVTFQYPVAICVLRVGVDFKLQSVTCLDAPAFRPRQIVEAFWKGVGHYRKQHRNLKLVTFNGRGFDLPLLELAAFRYGVSGGNHFQGGRHRFSGWHLDLMDWLTNYGGFRMNGGLDLLSKMLGKPGKMQVKGNKVYDMHRAGQVQEINDYCLRDTLDTYFVFLRTRVMTGELLLQLEQDRVQDAKRWISEHSGKHRGLRDYLDDWGDWRPWP